MLPVLQRLGSLLTFSVFFVFLSVTLLDDIECVHDFVINALEYRNSFGTVGQEMVRSCAPAFNFVSAEVKNIVKYRVFAPQGRHNIPIQIKFGMEAYTVGLL